MGYHKSVLGTILFILYINDLLHFMSPKPGITYCGDTTIIDFNEWHYYIVNK